MNALTSQQAADLALQADQERRRSPLLVAFGELVAAKGALDEYVAITHGGESAWEVFERIETLEAAYAAARVVFLSRLQADSGLDGNAVVAALS